MAEYSATSRIASADLIACVEETMHVATLRYFKREGAFADAVLREAGIPLPAVLEAREEAQLIFAWRSPTETLCVTRSTTRLAELGARLAACADLLSRLGGAASVPAVGEARRSRMADLAVLAISVRAGETLLVVDRVYLPHLLAWIRETLLDFEAS